MILNKKVHALENENVILKQPVQRNTEDNIKIYKEANYNTKSFKVMEEEIEDRTNRQLRKTLIIKGVPEVVNENWENTSQILAEIICNSVENISPDAALNQIERAHLRTTK